MLIFIIKITEGFCVSQDNKLLHIISNETKMSIDSISIVTPSIYTSETKNLRAEIEKLKESVYKDELTQAFIRKWMQDTYLENQENSFKED